MPLPDQALIRQRAEEILRGNRPLRIFDVLGHHMAQNMPEIRDMDAEPAAAYVQQIADACDTATITITWTDTEGEPT